MVLTDEEKMIIATFISQGYAEQGINNVVDFFTGLMSSDDNVRNAIIGQIIGYLELSIANVQSQIDSLENIKLQNQSRLNANIDLIDGLKTKFQGLIV